MSTYIVTNIRKFIHGVKSSFISPTSSYFYCHYSANSYSVGNSYNNSYNNNYSYNNYNYDYNQWFLICPVFPLIAATNNSNNNEKNAEFTNNYLLRFISKRMEDCKKKKDIQKRKNTLGKYSAWHSLIYNLEDVVLHDNIAAFIPDQPGFRYKGWLCMESILFLYGAWQSFITAGIDPYQAGVTLVYQKPYAPQASDSFVQLNAQTLDDNKTSVDELNLMRVSVDKYFTAYFSDSYQGGIKRLKSNDIDDDNNPVLSHTRYANKPINKTLLPTSDPPKLICMPSKSLHDAIKNNMCPPPLNPITNNMCPPPLNFITNNNVNNQNISNKNNNNTNIIPLHFHIQGPRAKTNVTTKSKNNKKIKITKNKGNDKQNNKQLGYLPKKKEIKTMSDKMKMIVAELRKDSKLDDKNKSLLIRLAETDAKNMCNITNGRACCVYTGLILKKISIDDFTSEDIHKLKIKLFDCVKSKQTHLTSKHTYGAEIGGFESKHGHRGQYMLKSDSYIARIFYELLNKSPKFEKQAIEVAKKLFKKENETDNDNDNDNDINDNKLNKRCLSPDDSLTGNPPAKRQKTMDTNIINNNTNDIALSFDNWNNDDLNNDSLPGLHLDSDDNKNNKNDIDTLERRKSWLCERIETKNSQI